MENLFRTVLVARSPRVPPSALEIHMRGCSGQIRVVEKLSGGAHLLLPGSEATVAIRTYYLKDLEKLDAVGSVTADCLDEWNRGAIPKRGIPELDGLSSFRDAFQCPVVFFVLPTDKSLDDHLGRPHSFVNCAQMIMNRWGTDGVNTRREQTYQGSAGRSFIVPDVPSIVTTLISLLDSLKPARRALKEQYFDQMRAKYFLPDSETGEPPIPNGAVSHVAGEFRALAERFGFPPGEADIIMSSLGSISNIAKADLSDSSMPIDETSKHILNQFFGSPTTPPTMYGSTDFGDDAMFAAEEPQYVVNNQGRSDHFEADAVLAGREPQYMSSNQGTHNHPWRHQHETSCVGRHREHFEYTSPQQAFGNGHGSGREMIPNRRQVRKF